MRAGPEGRRKTWLSLAAITAVILVAGVAGTFIYATRPQVEASVPARSSEVTVEVVTLTPAPVARTLTLTGTARAIRQARVAAETGGRVVWIAPECEPGSTVEAGQALLRLDPAPHEIAVAKAGARLARARAALAQQRIESEMQQRVLDAGEAELDVAEKELERLQSLFEQRVVSESEVDKTRAEYLRRESVCLAQRQRMRSDDALIAKAEADVKLAQAQLAEARLDLERTSVTAPFAGEVAERLVELGTMAASGQAVFELVDYATAVVDVEVSAHDVAVLRAPVAVEVATADGAPPRPGRLAYLGPSADAATRMFPAQVYVDNAAARLPLLPGQFATVRLTEAEPAARLAVPYAAVGQDGQGEYVFVVQDGRAERRAVRVLWQMDGRAVVQGLEAGLDLVVRGLRDLVPGAEVSVRPAAHDEAGEVGAS